MPIDKLLSTRYGHIIRQFMTYAFVGGIATVVDWGVFYLLNALLYVDYKLAVTCSFVLGATTNYLLNKTITFKDKTEALAIQLGVYSAVSAISLLLSVFLMWIFVKSLTLHPMIARIATTAIMLLLNFLFHKFITFNQALYNKVFLRQTSLLKKE